MSNVGLNRHYLLELSSKRAIEYDMRSQSASSYPKLKAKQDGGRVYWKELKN